MQFPIRVKTGEHTLTIEPMGAASPNATWLPRLRIEPDVSRGVTIDPLYFTRTNPTNMYMRGEREQGRMALVFDRNEGVEYDFEVRQAGAYRVSFQALEDQPGPVLLEVALDGRTQGVLAFSRADLSWSSQTLIANLPVGKHTLGVNAASEQDVGAAEPEKNNNLVLAQIDLVAATAGDTDERFHLGDELNLPPVTIANGFVTVGSESSELSWNLATYQDTPVDPDLRYQLEPDPGAPWPQATTVHFSMPAKGADTKLVSPVFRVKPATIIYYRAELRVENLLNHSANMQLLLFDKDGVPIDVIHARAQGITGSTPWVPFVFIDALPDDAASAALACVVYQNGKMTAPKGGEAFFRRLEWPMVLK